MVDRARIIRLGGRGAQRDLPRGPGRDAAGEQVVRDLDQACALTLGGDLRDVGGADARLQQAVGRRRTA